MHLLKHKDNHKDKVKDNHKDKDDLLFIAILLFFFFFFFFFGFCARGFSLCRGCSCVVGCCGLGEGQGKMGGSFDKGRWQKGQMREKEKKIR